MSCEGFHLDELVDLWVFVKAGNAAQAGSIGQIKSGDEGFAGAEIIFTMCAYEDLIAGFQGLKKCAEIGFQIRFARFDRAKKCDRFEPGAEGWPRTQPAPEENRGENREPCAERACGERDCGEARRCPHLSTQRREEGFR